MTNFNNFFCRIYSAVFSKEFYNFVFWKQKNNGFSTLVIILFLTYLIPAIIIHNRLANFSYEGGNDIALHLKEAFLQVPDLKIEEGMLQDNDILPVTIGLTGIEKNFIVIDKNINSPFNANSMIVFSKDGIYFNQGELIFILLRILKFDNRKIENISSNTGFIPYPQNDESFNGDFLLNLSEKYIKSLAGNILFTLLPAIVIFSSILKFIEAFLLSLIARVIAGRLNVKYNTSQIFRLTIASMIPVSLIKFINGASLWSSAILANPMSILLLFAANLYFIYFALKSVKTE